MAASPTFESPDFVYPVIEVLTRLSRDRSDENTTHVLLPHGVDFLLTGYLLVLWKEKSSRQHN